MQVTIVGGGFGGVKTALELSKHEKNEVTLITDKTYFQYYPALYSSATGRSHLQSWIPLSEIFGDRTNVTVHIDTITNIDGDKKTLKGESGVTYEYKTCVLALGSVTTFFGIKGLDTYAYGIKSAEEIRRLKQHIYHSIAEKGTLDSEYVIIGGGPTGVELASSLGQYIKRLAKRYRVRRHKVKIRLVEAAPRVLPRMNEITSDRVTKRLEKLGVVVETNKKVESASVDGLMVSGKEIDTQTVIWTSGVANHPFFEKNSKWFKTAPNHKITVDEHFMAYKDIYVIGDNADTPYSGLAQIAIRNADELSRNLIRRANGKPMKKYSQSTPAVVIPIGRWWAAFEWKWLRFYGWPAWIVRMAADFVGYRDILSTSSALAKLRSGELIEYDYFTPTKSPRK